MAEAQADRKATNSDLTCPSLSWAFCGFLLLAALCSMPRFGQRENEHYPGVSDSDLYLEMARVFTGDAPGFTADWVAWQPHHYNRPLHSFLAGWLGKYAFGGNLRAAFSVVDILAAATLAWVFWRQVRRYRPAWRLAWMPSVLFLTGFPQLNWGYHILTDTLGLATAFLTGVFAERIIENETQPQRALRWWGQVSLLFALSSLAFLARETAWLAVVSSAWIIWSRCRQAGTLSPGLIAVMAALVLGKIPHTIYAHLYHVSGVPLRSSVPALLDWRYVLDFVLKSGICFHLSWFLAVPAFFGSPDKRAPLPPLIVGWAIAGLLYMGAGYFVNKISGIGYPLRMTYVLFPVVFLQSTALLERLRAERRRRMAVGFCAAHYAVGMAGVLLDPGSAGVTAVVVIEKIKQLLKR